MAWVPNPAHGFALPTSLNCAVPTLALCPFEIANVPYSMLDGAFRAGVPRLHFLAPMDAARRLPLDRILTVKNES